MSGKPKQIHIELTEMERKTLELVAMQNNGESRRAKRAKVLLASAQGDTNRAIAQQVCLSDSAVARLIRKSHLVGPLGAIEDLKRSGRPHEISEAACLWIRSIAAISPKTIQQTLDPQWTISTLTSYLRKKGPMSGYPSLSKIAASKVRTILLENDNIPNTVRLVHKRKYSDRFSEKQTVILYKAVEIVLSEQGRNDNHKLAIQDTGIQIHYLDASSQADFSKLSPLQTMSLLAGIDLMTGQICGCVSLRNEKQEFLNFLKKLDSQYAPGCTIILVLKNDPVHTSAEVRKFLNSKKGRFRFIFRPKRTAWLNLVEGFFSRLARVGLRNIKSVDPQFVAADIYTWIEDVNREPVISRWLASENDLTDVLL